MKTLILTTLGAALLLSSTGAFADQPNKGFERSAHHASRPDLVVIQHYRVPAPPGHSVRNHEWTKRDLYRQLQRDRLLATKARQQYGYQRYHNQHSRRLDDRHFDRYFDRHHDHHYRQTAKAHHRKVQQRR